MSHGSETNASQHGREKRADPRYGAHFDVRFARRKDAAKAFQAWSVNFSAGGLCVRSSTHYEVGELLALSLFIEGQCFELDGVVAWVRGDAVGVRFANVAPDVRAQLEAVARVLARQG